MGETQNLKLNTNGPFGKRAKSDVEDYDFNSNMEIIDTAIAAGLQAASVTLTAAQIKALKATPIQIIPAPGAGKAINLIQAVWQYKFGTVPYGNVPSFPTATLDISQGDINTSDFGLAAAFAEGFLDQNQNMVQIQPQIPPSGVGIVGTQAEIENVAVHLGNSGPSEFTNGDGTLTVTVYYTVVTLS
jgi:hypothetical protein